ncbi:unnamed protein product [Urochloa humidicola]
MAKNRVYEEYDPSVEWTRGAEADSVRISLPGFKREEIRVLVDNHGHLRTSGERPVAGTRWSRFQKDFKLPDNCNADADGIRAKFEAEALTITLPKKTPSPPVPELPTNRRPVAAAPSKRIPPPPPAALPEPPAVPAAALAPAAAAAPPQRPPAERRPSLPRKPSVTEPAAAAAPELPARLPSVPTPADVAAKPHPALAIAKKAAKQAEEEEKKRMEREMMGKMEEDRKAMQEKAQQEQRDEAAAAAAMGETAEMARQPRPASASRGLLVNVAVAMVVLLGITVYVWHNLRNAAAGGGHGHLGAGSYGDEM